MLQQVTLLTVYVTIYTLDLLPGLAGSLLYSQLNGSSAW